jgi:hypothetical protein
MSEQVGILFKDGKATASFESDLVSIEFDANLSEGHSWSNDITSNPVERGVDVTDHIREIPDQVTLVGFVTNTPFLDNEDGNTITNDDEDRVQAVVDRLRQIRAERSTVLIFTKYVLYEDMGIKSVDFTRDASNTNSVIFTVQFQNIKFAETQTVNVPAGISKKLDKKAGDGTQKKTEPQKAGGAKQPKEPEQSSSVLSSILPKIKESFSGTAQ